MEEKLSEEKKYQMAKQQVAALKGLYIHLIVFATIMTGLVALDFANGGSWWVQWPLIGWGLGVLGHAYLVTSTRSSAPSAWEERKIRELMSKM